MTTHTLYSGPAGTGRLVITARPAFHTYSSPVWLVNFQRWGKAGGKMLDQCAVWIPDDGAASCGGDGGWDRSRWIPYRSRFVPRHVGLHVETWLRGRPVGELKTTTAPRST
jgi:hypothetical protein